MKRIPLLLLAALAATACASLGQPSLFISQGTEVKMGKQFDQELSKEMPPYTGDPIVQKFVQALGKKIVPHTDRPKLKYHFKVIDSEEVNAFAVPGGWVYVTTGLLKMANSSAEVASVLAHELGHISARHGVKALETYAIAQGISDLLGEGSIGTLVSAAIQTGTGLAFSKDQEREADKLGLKYTKAAGFNPWGLVHFFKSLQKASGGPTKSTGALSKIGEFFSTHPPTTERINNSKKQLSRLKITEKSTGLRWDSDIDLPQVKAALAKK